MTAPNHASRVAIIGAGFAGLVAARELEAAGCAVEIFEARDRVGGRAWTDHRLGRNLEMGATWVHWLQPFVWTEIERYDQGIHPSPDVEKAFWLVGGQVRSGSEDELDAILYGAQAQIMAGSDEFFPYPHDPLHVLTDPGTPQELRERFREADNTNVLDVLRAEGADPAALALADSYWSAGYQGATGDTSRLMAMHWASLANHDARLLDQLTLQFKLDDGMKGLYEAIAADVRGPIHLEAPVSAVRETPAGAHLETAAGPRDVDAVIVTVPLGALRTIAFEPALSAAQQQLAERGFCSTGFKIWIRLAGRHSVIAAAPSDYPINLIKTEYDGADDSTILVGFGHDHAEIDLTDPTVAQQMIDIWMPGATVLEVTGHDWSGDQWSGQTWATLRRGQFIQGWNLFGTERGAVRFAGADWAPGWTGVCVDGALQSGITTARRLLRTTLRR